MFLRELAQQKATKQPHQIDDLTANAPIFATMDFFPTTHGLEHVFEKLEKAIGGKLVGLNSALPEADASTSIGRAELGVLGFKLTAGVDTVKLVANGDWAKYIARKVPHIMRKTSMESETSLIYDLLLPFAKKQGQIINADAQAESDDRYSLVAVRWEDDELCGLFDPDGFGQGALLETIMLSGGLPYDKDGKTVYGADFKSYLGFLLESKNNIGSIVNINASHIPTATQIDDMLDQCRAGQSGKTYIYGHPKALRMLNDIKGNALSMKTSDTNYSRRIKTWDGIELVESYNFKHGTEKAIKKV